MPVVRLTDVGFAYDGGPHVLVGVDLTVERGEFVAIAGPNGGGKTTLMRLIVGLDHPTRGKVELFDGTAAGARVGYLPQRAELGIDAPITVTELATAGRAARRGVIGRLDASDRAAIDRAVERVGLDAQRRVPLSRLSGGQRQRAFIAKALAAEPELLILDEPTAGVDAAAQEALAALIDELRRALSMTVLYVSHEFGAVEPYVERLVIVRGGIEFDGPPVGAASSRFHDPSHVHP
jgi:zinc transport system ATP-binding protein